MKGGTKTKAGKGRIVPIHSKIKPFIEVRLTANSPRLFFFRESLVKSGFSRN